MGFVLVPFEVAVKKYWQQHYKGDRAHFISQFQVIVHHWGGMRAEAWGHIMSTARRQQWGHTCLQLGSLSPFSFSPAQEMLLTLRVSLPISQAYIKAISRRFQIFASWQLTLSQAFIRKKKNTKTWPKLILYTKIMSKRTITLNVQCKNGTLIKDKRGRSDWVKWVIGLSEELLDTK